MNSYFNIDERLQAVSKKALEMARPAFARIDEVAEHNQQKVLAAFIHHRVSDSHFAATTGYGYGDRGRDTLDAVFAECMGAEDALVRHSILSGTHAIGIALFGVLRPGDVMLAVTGAPYDTLNDVICGGDGSLSEWGVKYAEVALEADGVPDLPAIRAAVQKYKPRVVHIQRSRGYNTRPSLTIADISAVTAAVREVDGECILFVDNCYGEFVETDEPSAAGADLMAGSLIKNPGGGIADNGGYICGRADLVEMCAARMTVPGIGREVGASLGHNRALYMGLFNAPHVVGEALKTAVFCAAMFSLLGFEVSPSPTQARGDIIQSVTLGDAQRLVAFCQGMQRGAPVDSFVVPEPWDMPGYRNPVIMAAGAFTMGASIELSADAPIREPFAAYMQGGLNFHSGKVGVLLAAQLMLERGLFPSL